MTLLKLTQQEVDNIIQNHQIWLQSLNGKVPTTETDCKLRAKFDAVDISGLKFDGANLQYAWICHSIATGASFKNANLFLADLRHTEFNQANFYGANLQYVNLVHATCIGTNFTKANLVGANCASAKIKSVKLVKTKFIDVAEAAEFNKF